MISFFIFWKRETISIKGNEGKMSREYLIKGIPLANGKVKLKVSKDYLKAYLICNSELDVELLSDLKSMLDEHGIIYGVLRFPRREGKEWIIAQGDPPKNGQDGKIEVYPFPEMSEKDLPGICVDERSRSRIVNVKKGTLVARKTPPTPGTPGMNVFGEEIPPTSGAWPVFKVGEGVEVQPDQRTLVSLVDGKLDVSKDGTISVLSHWNIDGDLDISIGNIEFWGELLVISGSIHIGIKLKTLGDLEVKGNIEDEVKVEADGNVIVHGIIRSRKTEVNVGKDLFCNAIEYARITVRGDLEVSDYMLDAIANISGHLLAVEGRGLVAGGVVRAGRSVAVNVVGSPSFSRTKIFAGIDPILEKRYKETVRELEEIAQHLTQIKEGLTKVMKLENERGGLKGKGKEIKESLVEAFNNLKEKLTEKRNEIAALESKIGQLQQSQIQILKVVHANTQIGIYTATYEVPQDMEKVVFSFEKGRVLHRPL